MNRELPDEVLRGQMYYADLDPVIGSEQGGNRPVLVIQNNIGNRHSPTIIIAPITTRVKKLHQPTHIGVPPYFGLPQNSMVMLEQIRTIDKSRLGSYVGCLDDDVMDYKKREDAAPQELLDATLSVSDVAKLLGIHRNSVYNMVNKRDLFVTVKVNDKIRIYKDSFEAWYKSQNRHTIVAS